MKTYVLMASRMIGFYTTDYISCDVRAKATEKLNDISTTLYTIGCATPRVDIRNSITLFVPDCDYD
jgi:hypothetical protein